MFVSEFSPVGEPVIWCGYQWVLKPGCTGIAVLLPCCADSEAGEYKGLSANGKIFENKAEDPVGKLGYEY